MRIVNNISRSKEILQFSNIDEFKKGEWLKNLPSSKDDVLVEINFKSNNNIMIINVMKAKSLKEYMEEKDDGKREAKN